MSDTNLSDRIVVVDLFAEPKMLDELEAVTTAVRDKGDCDVVIDFCNVDIITSSGIATLMELRRLLHEHKHRLVLCGVSQAIQGIFAVTGLDRVFEFADDRVTALTLVHWQQL
jgi:anti-sigma B factor antagonist